MALRDVLRDTGALDMEHLIAGDGAVRAEREKLETLGDEDLWALHTSLGLVSAKGRAVAGILWERHPDSIRLGNLGK